VSLPKRSLNDGTDESGLLLAFCIIYLRVHSSSDVRLKLCSSGVLAAVFELQQEPLCKLYQPRVSQTNSHRPEVRVGLEDFWFWLSVCYLFNKRTHYTHAHSVCNIVLWYSSASRFLLDSCGANWISSNRVRTRYDNETERRELILWRNGDDFISSCFNNARF